MKRYFRRARGYIAASYVCPRTALQMVFANCADLAVFLPTLLFIHPALAAYFAGNWIGLGWDRFSLVARVAIGLGVYIPIVAAFISVMHMNVGANGFTDD